MTPEEFLTARIAEDEAAAQAAIDDDGGEDEGFAGQYDRLVGTGHPLDFTPRFGEAAAQMICRFAIPARVLAECKAKRELLAIDNFYANTTGDEIVRALLLPYTYHPDFPSVHW